MFLYLLGFCIICIHLAATVVFMLYSFDSIYFHMIRSFFEMLQMLYSIKSHNRKVSKKRWTFPDFYEETVDQRPESILFQIAETGEEFSRKKVDDHSNQIARWAKLNNLKQGDTIALMMSNRPEFFSFWLGMSKVGVSSGLLNTNLMGKSLLHSVELAVASSSTKILVYDGEAKSNVEAELSELKSRNITVFFWDDISSSICDLSSNRPSTQERSNIADTDTLIYIYTSGTTGMPKASKISHTRYFNAGNVLQVMCYLKPQDRFYICLPLYHSAGGVIGLCGVLRSGCTMVLRKKFSVKSFTSDCLKYRVVAMQYIGELCRYLLNAPVNDGDAKLQIKFAFGNGMRPDVWTKFKQRYNIGRIIEFYGATEGNFSLFNSTGRVGALGFLPTFARFFVPVKLLKVDPNQRDVPLRNTKGLCIMCKPGEVGLAVNRIASSGSMGKFEGYSDSGASSKKILKDVVAKGDAFFNTGDLLSCDNMGFFYWSDRVGDTFRWKGENVATTEVELVLGAIAGIAEVAVYGVQIPNCDGRAGMAAVTLGDGVAEKSLDWSVFHTECVKHLPVYSRPLFVRVRKQIAVTTTFKHQKSDLVKDGYDLSLVKDDAIYFYNTKEGTFVLLTEEMANEINTGVIKV